jgi:hypothetical protein
VPAREREPGADGLFAGPLNKVTPWLVAASRCANETGRDGNAPEAVGSRAREELELN